MRGLSVLMGVLVAVAAALGGCGSDGGESAAQVACSRFATVARDYTDGLLTTSELRDRLQGVHRYSSASDDDDLATAGRDMVSAVTSGTDAELAAAVNRFGEACESGGY